MRNLNLSSFIVLGLIMSACGGGGGGGSTTPVASSSTTVVSSSSVSSEAPSSSSSSLSTSSSSSSSSSAASASLVANMTTGWRGNGSGNSGIVYGDGSVSFTASATDVGAVFDIPPTKLEGAVISMVVNVSNEFKASGADLQIFAQVKNTWVGEWDCYSANGTFLAGTDTNLTCNVYEADDRFNQSVNDVQIGVQAK